MDTEKNNTSVSIMASPEKVIPKFASSVNFKKLDDGNIIFTFIFSPDGQSGSLIETVMVDTAHAKEIVTILTKVIDGKI